MLNYAFLVLFDEWRARIGLALIENDVETAQNMSNAAQVVLQFAEKMLLKPRFDVNEFGDEEMEQVSDYVPAEQVQSTFDDRRHSDAVSSTRVDSPSMEPTRRNEDMRETQRSRATYDRPGKPITKMIIYKLEIFRFYISKFGWTQMAESFTGGDVLQIQ
jgi:hypothetical protein